MDMCVPTQLKNQWFLQLLLTQQLLVASKGVRWLQIVEAAFIYGDTIRTEDLCPRPHFCEWLGQLKVHTLGGLDSHCLTSDSYTLYDWSLLITQEDTIVHNSHKIYPTVTSPEGEGSFPCCDGLCHEIERDSPRSHFPRQTFVGDSGRLLLTHGVQWLGWNWRE